MPFTVAHVTAVLPGVRWHHRLHLDPTCLVIGSMAPDFEYFARGELVSRISHTLVGLVVWNLPATLLLAVLWHFLVKRPALEVLPARLAARVTPVFGQPWRTHWSAATIVSVVVSALLGALTHLLWDGFTHASGAIARQLPSLSTIYELPAVGDIALHRILQHTSTLVGLTVLALYVVHAVRKLPAAPLDAAPAHARTRRRLRLVFATCLAIGVALMAYRLRRMHLHDPGSVIAGVISGLLAGMIAASALTRQHARALARHAGS